MTSVKRRIIMISAGLVMSLGAASASAETYLVHLTAEIVETKIRGSGTLPEEYSVGQTMSGVFEIDSRRSDRIRGGRSDGRGAMQFTQTPKTLSFDAPSPLSYRNGRLLLTGDGAVRWGNPEDYCNGYAASRRLFCTATGSIEVTQEASDGETQSYTATNFSFSLPEGMDPTLELLDALEELASLANNGGSKLVLGFSDTKRRADQDRVRLMLDVTSMEFRFK